VFDAALAEDRRRVIVTLIATLNESTLRRQEIVLNARGPLLERALDATRHLADDRVPRLAAWQRYSGVVWSHLDPATLEPAQRRRILVPSSLYGITSGEDRIADFRLKMNVGIAPLGTMSTFWKPRVTPVLAAHARRSTIVIFCHSSTKRPLIWRSSREHDASCECSSSMAKGARPSDTTRKR